MNITHCTNNIKKDWILIDAQDKIFGRVVTQIASKLIGKHKPQYVPNMVCGDFVVLINASKVKFNGSKLKDKVYYRHTGYFGGVKSDKLSDLLSKNPEKLFRLATRGMLPKTKLGRAMLKKLKVYSDSNHPHTAQIKGNKNNE